MPGPKREPTSLKKLKGNPSKRRLPKDEPAPGGQAEKPEWLTLEAAREWDEIVPPLVSAGLATSADVVALAVLVETFAQFKRLRDLTYGREIMAKGGRSVTSDDGETVWETPPTLVKHPLLPALAQARDTLLRYADHFGMTPSARAKIALPDQGGKRDDFDTFLRLAQ